MNHQQITTVIALSTLILCPQRLPASVSGEVVETVVKSLARGAAIDSAEQLAKAGGRTAVREVLETAAREGGETLVRRCTLLLEEQGITALLALKTSPKLIIAALDHLPAAARGPALGALEREGVTLLRLLETHGPRALEVATLHPGVGSRLVTRLGSEVLELAPALSTDQAIGLARHADDIARLPPAQKSTLLNLVKTAPDKALGYLETHPKALAIGASAIGVYAMRDHLLGTPGQITGAPTDPQGALDRAYYWTLQVARQPLHWLTAAAIAIASIWATVKIVILWRRSHPTRPPAAKAATASRR